MILTRGAFRLFIVPVLLIWAWMPAWAAPANSLSLPNWFSNSESLRFQILRNGRQIGTHSFSFHRDAGKLVVDVDLNIRVRVLFLTIYTYRQIAREVWRDGRLVRFTVRTMDDGRTSRLDGIATASAFFVTGDMGSHSVPPDIVPATYWHPETAQQSRLMDPTTGEVYEVEFSEEGVERVETSAGIVPSHRYEMLRGEEITLWYDSRHCLTKARYLADEDGSLIEFRLTSNHGAKGAIAN